ncbi:hypothetical protein [Citrobacter phage Ci1]|nr:hypothetical protein [Citrobacter phage Ci1]
MKIFAIIMSVLLLIAIAVGGTLISYNNTAVRFENNIGKFDKESQNTLSNYTMKLKEKAQVPDMYVQDLGTIVDKTFKGRYGEDGSKAMFQFLKETMPNFDSSLYKELQITMEAGRNEFKLSQSRKLDICTQYQTMTGTFPANIIFGIVNKGYQNVEKQCTILVDESTSVKFASGTDSVIKLR